MSVYSTTLLESFSLRLAPLPEQQEFVRRVESLFALADQFEARPTAAQRQVDALTTVLLARSVGLRPFAPRSSSRTFPTCSALGPTRPPQHPNELASRLVKRVQKNASYEICSIARGRRGDSRRG